jgi:hypothetical protein
MIRPFMGRPGRLLVGAVALLGAVSAAHVTLTHGGFRKVVERAGNAGTGREELTVGHLPVT